MLTLILDPVADVTVLLNRLAVLWSSLSGLAVLLSRLVVLLNSRLTMFLSNLVRLRLSKRFKRFRRLVLRRAF